MCRNPIARLALSLTVIAFFLSGCAASGKSGKPESASDRFAKDWKQHDASIDSGQSAKAAEAKPGLDTALIKQLSEATRLLLATIDNYVEVVPTSSRVPEVIMLKGHTFYNNRLYQKARDSYTDIVSNHSKAPEASEAIKMTAQSFYEEKRFDEAQEWYRKLKETAVSGVDREEAMTRLAEAYFKQGEKLREQKDFRGAVSQFERVFTEFPTCPIADISLYNVAVIRDENREWTQALLSYNKLIANYPKSQYLESGFFRMAKDYEQINNWAKAASTYLEAIQRFPGSSQIKDAVYNAAIAYEKNEDFSAAAKLFEKYAAEWPNDKDAPDVLFKAGEIYGKLEDWGNVERINGLFSRKYGNDRERVVMAICMSGIASYMQKKYDQAILELERAVATGKKAGLDIKANAFYSAKAQFTIGEIRQLQAEQIRLTGDYQGNLKKRISRIEETVSAYTKVSHYKLMEFTVKAIYRIGECYEQFGAALFKRDRPKNLSIDKLLALEEGISEAVEKYLAVKALEAHEQNVRFGIQYQYEDEWIKRSRQQLTKLPLLSARNYAQLIKIASSEPLGDTTVSAMKLIQKKLTRLQSIAPYQDKAIALNLKTLEMAAKYSIDDKFKTEASSEVTRLSFEVGATYAEIVALARSAPTPPSYDGYKRFFYKVHLLGEGLVEYENQAITALYKNIKIGDAYSIRDEWIRKSKEKIAEVLFTRSLCYEILSMEALRSPPIPEGVSEAENDEYQLQFEELGYKLQDEALSIYRDINEKGKQNITTGAYLDMAYARLFVRVPTEVGEKIAKDTLLAIRGSKDWLYGNAPEGDWGALDFVDTAWSIGIKGSRPDSLAPVGFSDSVATLWGGETGADAKILPETVVLRRYFRTNLASSKMVLEYAAPGPIEIKINGTTVVKDTLKASPGWFRAKKKDLSSLRLIAGKNCLALRVSSTIQNARTVYLHFAYEDRITELLPKLPSMESPISKAKFKQLKFNFPVIPNFEYKPELLQPL